MEWENDPDLYPPYLRSRVRRGLGIGSRTSYRPWKNIQNSGTKGTVACVHGILVDRRYEILDDRARTYFFLIERSRHIADIRETWPILDIDSTLRLSQKFKVNHPRHDIFPEPLSVDFLITETGPADVRYRAVALVGCHHMSIRDRRLKQVQQQWCNDHDIDWTLVDTSQLDRTVLDALRFVRAWYRHRYVPDGRIADLFAENFMAQYQNNLVLDDLVELARKKLRIRADTALDLFRFCAWSHRIPVSLTDRIAKNRPVVLRKVNDA
ncbi:hypothetical protein WN982_25960 [Paraburkholderia sp. IMGN_8]|uniref:hypothetical protein n=1 Tax=Paraburkholderia sp. IMGN_8 TaxID=3136564 RepID=UPI003101AF77